MSVRVRYAPSPTGLQHIGGVRTALFNYFFAKAMGGKFFLRIEDTDQGRLDDRAIQDIYDTFDWLGITLDEGPREGGSFGPYVQSERLSLYREYADKLIASGHAYPCFCTAADLEDMRNRQTASGQPTGYDRRCLQLDPAQVRANQAAGLRQVIRFKVPQTGESLVRDVLLGDVVWPNKDISNDPVILKADGFPTYHLAHAVDDHLMETSHVLRGQEWLPSAPLHVLLFQAFGWKPPLYCHLSMIMGADGHKLSKRHGSTSAQEFRLGGYVPAAIINYITLLGWSNGGDQDIFAKSDLERIFSLEKLSKSPAIFDYQKLDYFNGYWIRQLPDAEIARLILPILQASGLVDGSQGDGAKDDELKLLSAGVPIARERLHKLTDAPVVLGFLFRKPDFTDRLAFIPKKQTAEEVSSVLKRLVETFTGFTDRSDEENEHYFHGLAETWGMKVGLVLMPLRLAVTGTTASPPLMASIRILGVEKTVERIKNAIAILEQPVG